MTREYYRVKSQNRGRGRAGPLLAMLVQVLLSWKPGAGLTTQMQLPASTELLHKGSGYFPISASTHGITSPGFDEAAHPPKPDLVAHHLRPVHSSRTDEMLFLQHDEPLSMQQTCMRHAD